MHACLKATNVHYLKKTHRCVKNYCFNSVEHPAGWQGSFNLQVFSLANYLKGMREGAFFLLGKTHFALHCPLFIHDPYFIL